MRVVRSAVAAALAALVIASCATTMTQAPPAMTPAGVRFVLMRAEATSVAVAGSFNQWSAASHPLVRAKAGGLWTIVVPLPPGEHAFMYVVDGKEWVSPPLAEDYVDDGFGAKNGIVFVRR
jgi:1,4-alpha-glucan branching enzyme